MVGGGGVSRGVCSLDEEVRCCNFFNLRLSILFEWVEKACVIREILLDGKVADVV